MGVSFRSVVADMQRLRARHSKSMADAVERIHVSSVVVRALFLLVLYFAGLAKGFPLNEHGAF